MSPLFGVVIGSDASTQTMSLPSESNEQRPREMSFFADLSTLEPLALVHTPRTVKRRGYRGRPQGESFAR